MGPLTPTSKGAWVLAFERHEAARVLLEQLTKARTEASTALERAGYDLNAHEACPGVPRWQHLQSTPDADACRLNACREHGRYMSSLPYATPYQPDQPDDGGPDYDDEQPF